MCRKLEGDSDAEFDNSQVLRQSYGFQRAECKDVGAGDLETSKNVSLRALYESLRWSQGNPSRSKIPRQYSVKSLQMMPPTIFNQGFRRKIRRGIRWILTALAWDMALLLPEGSELIWQGLLLRIVRVWKLSR
jgi:hypothetical protein